MKNIPNELAPCGVFCGACPSFNKSCLGCPSESKKQKRTSKWGCKIRNCCYNEKKQDFCVGDNRFKYRHEISENFTKLKELGLGGYQEYQKQKWSCPLCDGTVYFYHYKCSKCGNEMSV